MSKEMSKNDIAVEDVAVAPAEKKAKKPAAKKENIFKRIWKKFVKLCKDTAGEMKKVVWTPKAELVKNTKLVILAVVIVAVAILAIDTGFSYLINTIAGLIG